MKNALTTIYSGSPREYDCAIERNVQIPVRDGVRLATDIYHPACKSDIVSAAFPTILIRTPYDRTRRALSVSGRYFASHGYNFVAQDCRGRFDSEGEFRFFFNEHHEGLDGYDTVEWIAEQAWSDGKVGTTGLSFEGANQQALAITNSPHLVTQVILDGGYNYYERTIRQCGAFSEGIFFPYVFFMAMVGGHEAAPSRPTRHALREVLENIPEWSKHLPLRRGSSPLALTPAYESWYLDMATRSDYDELWQNPTVNFQKHIDQYPDIPVCLVTSWYGHHAWANFEKWKMLAHRNSHPVKLVCGMWVHGAGFMEESVAGEVEFGDAAAVGYLDEFLLRWFDRYLKDLDTGIDEGSPIEIFVMGGGSGRLLEGGVGGIEKQLEHGGQWRSETEWPLARTDWMSYYLRADGSLETDPAADEEAFTTYTYSPEHPVPTIGGSLQNPIGVSGFVYGGAFDQRGRSDLIMCEDSLPLAARQDVLVFRTEPLAEPLEVTGPVEVRVWVSSSAVDTDFTAKLIDEYPSSDDYPDGFAMNLCDGIVRMRYRDRGPKAELIEPGRIYEISVGPMLISNVFAPGHRIRLDISSSSSPQFDVNPNTGAPLGLSGGTVTARNTVYHDRLRPSRVHLPIIS